MAALALDALKLKLAKLLEARDYLPTCVTAHAVSGEYSTLLTWGRDDRVSPPDMALLPMRTIPNAELHIFPNSGHWAMIEAKEAFESAVLAFLSRRVKSEEPNT